MSLKVIDVSRYQGIIDWDKVKKNCAAAIIQCGYGSDLKKQDDVRWERNVKECERLGIPWSPYLFSYADNETRAKSEVKHILRCLEGHNPTFNICYTDIEETNCGAYARKNAEIFAKGMRAAGYVPGLYTYESYFNTFLPGYKGLPLWIAKYSSVKPSIGVYYDAWQYTSNGSVPGISGRVDLSDFYKDYRVKKPTKPAAVKEAAKAVPEITYQVKTGHRGTGALIKGQSDAYAGLMDDCIVAIKIGVTEGRIEYRVHLLNGGWLPKVSGCSWTDHLNGYAGDGHSTIDALQVYYYSKKGNYAVKYKVKLPTGKWLGTITDTNWQSNDGNRTAGIFGNPFTAVKMWLEEI